jgi:hypothetical protein
MGPPVEAVHVDSALVGAVARDLGPEGADARSGPTIPGYGLARPSLVELRERLRRLAPGVDAVAALTLAAARAGVDVGDAADADLGIDELAAVASALTVERGLLGVIGRSMLIRAVSYVELASAPADAGAQEAA